jgi:hypothetical protein
LGGNVKEWKYKDFSNDRYFTSLKTHRTLRASRTSIRAKQPKLDTTEKKPPLGYEKCSSNYLQILAALFFPIDSLAGVPENTYAA